MLMLLNVICYNILLFFANVEGNSSVNATAAMRVSSSRIKQGLPEVQLPSFQRTSIKASSHPIHLKLGGKTRLSCAVRGRSMSSLHFQWHFRPKKHNSTEILLNESKSPVLRIVNARSDDSGRYRCEAANEAGSNNLTFYVLIDSNNAVNKAKFGRKENPKLPHWTNKKKMLKQLHAEPAGNTAVFRCVTDGESPLRAKWFKDDTKLTKDSRIGGLKFRHRNQTILLESVVVSDKGLYTCVIFNKYGSINHTYELDVAERSASRPIIPGGLLKNESVYIGSDVSFHCKVISDTHPHVEWLKINSSTQYTVMKKAGVNTTNDDMQTLTIRNVTYDDAGEYTCLAGNAIGITHRSAWLTVIPVPNSTSAMSDHVTHVSKSLIYVFGGICALIIVLFIVYLARSRYRSKAPQLIPIKNPNNIPAMTKLEEPVMLIGNEQAWKRMCYTDHVEINIQPDLQWELKRENIRLLDRIDEGFFGQVYKADLVYCVSGKTENLDAAVKMLKSTRTEKDMLDLLTEMDQMKRVGKHTNIINLLGVCTQNGLLWLVTEFAQQGNLRDYLRRNRPANMQYHLVDPNSAHTPTPRSEPLSHKDLMSAAYQVARGMEYLAQKKCIHRDLAARNVLVTDDYVMKIADFGLARDIRSNDYYRKQTRGHLPYKWMALEAMLDNIFTHATDVWSFGVLLWEIFSLGGSPYPGVKTHELVRFLKQGERLDQPQFSSPELYRLMRDCWEESPHRRPKFRQLVEDLDRMLGDTSSADYIDLTLPMPGYCISESDDSNLIDESSRDSANATGEDNDSVFDHCGSQLLPDDVMTDHHYDNEEEGPLLGNGVDIDLCNDHALQYRV